MRAAVARGQVLRAADRRSPTVAHARRPVAQLTQFGRCGLHRQRIAAPVEPRATGRPLPVGRSGCRGQYARTGALRRRRHLDPGGLGHRASPTARSHKAPVLGSGHVRGDRPTAGVREVWAPVPVAILRPRGRPLPLSLPIYSAVPTGPGRDGRRRIPLPCPRLCPSTSREGLRQVGFARGGSASVAIHPALPAGGYQCDRLSGRTAVARRRLQRVDPCDPGRPDTLLHGGRVGCLGFRGSPAGTGRVDPVCRRRPGFLRPELLGLSAHDPARPVYCRYRHAAVARR